MRRLLPVLALGLAACPIAADEIHIDAKALFARSASENIQLSADGVAVELSAGELFEDDGPAAGYSYKPNEERLSDRVWVKKELVIRDPRTRAATLLIGPGGGPGVRINGKAVESRPVGKAGGYWEAYTIPPDVLKSGTNDIVLHGSGRVWISRAEDFAAGSTDRPKHANRSARSADGGESWDRDRLGPAGDIDGEYSVRLFLERYRSSGSLVLPVADLGNLSGAAIAPPLDRIDSIRLSVAAKASPSGRVAVRVRTGTAPIPDAKTWSHWEALGDGGEIRDPKGRYLQVKVELTTTDPRESPRLKRLTIAGDVRKAVDRAADLKVTEIHNADIVRSSIPFTYEPFDHPRLKKLREEFKLDEVTAGAKSEFELIERLARWSSARWERGHLSERYPPWDALEILKPHGDGTPVGGFCQQYNVVLLQACESFGIPGRAVSIGPGDHGSGIKGGGHEVVELWSNQFRKWIYVDGDLAWYAVDAANGVPLSLWELRRRQLSALRGEPFEPVRIIEFGKKRKRWTGLTDWPPFAELRLIPRSNFLEKPSPLPLNQGMRGWFWTGHHVWTDSEYPASMLYSNRVTSRRDWEWTLNQAHFTLESTAVAGELRVHLDTQTPGFGKFLAEMDGQDARPVQSGFLWKLHSGKNTLAVRPRNIAGREGITSRVVIERP